MTRFSFNVLTLIMKSGSDRTDYNMVNEPRRTCKLQPVRRYFIPSTSNPGSLISWPPPFNFNILGVDRSLTCYGELFFFCGFIWEVYCGEIDQNFGNFYLNKNPWLHYYSIMIICLIYG